MKNDYRRREESGRYDHETVTLEASPPVEGGNPSRPSKPKPASASTIERLREKLVPGSAEGVTGSQNQGENEQLKKQDY